MHVTVVPLLEQVVAIAQEARIEIEDIAFIAGENDDLEALNLQINGPQECQDYFSWLLSKCHLMFASAA